MSAPLAARTLARLMILALVATRLIACRHSVASAVPLSAIDQPIEIGWPAVNRWNERFESEYGEFVARLATAIAEHRCHRLDECLRDATANTTFEPAIDADLRLSLDCADLPYVLRAYFAFKRRLPFAFVSAMHGVGADPRYATESVPTHSRSWREFRTPRSVLRGVSDIVHSGMYRLAPGIETGDFFPVAVNRRAVRAGTIFYDPNGHVLVVAQVRPDGVVYFIDGHPDGSLTWKRFGQAFVVGTARLGGGFKNFRPLAIEGGRIVRAGNASLTDFDARSQYAPELRPTGTAATGYHAWVRASLAETDARPDPLTDFREQTRALCRDVADRVEAVELAVTAGLAARAHPGTLPDNIYGTDGDWEIYSTPSRDARLKAAFRELAGAVRALPDLAARITEFSNAWREEATAPACQFAYNDSRRHPVHFSIETVSNRLFDLSFDPYHCPELRWGAAEGSDELAACPDSASKREIYRAERRLRNRIDRDYGVATPLESGPESPPDIDLRRLFEGPVCGP